MLVDGPPVMMTWVGNIPQVQEKVDGPWIIKKWNGSNPQICKKVNMVLIHHGQGNIIPF
jgi:hypothetical protein